MAKVIPGKPWLFEKIPLELMITITMKRKNRELTYILVYSYVVGYYMDQEVSVEECSNR
jgi:hypothetical protein